MATITFHADDNGIQNLSGSGLGFFGSTFGASVSVGSYQNSTYITDGNGITQGPNVHNIKWTHPSSGSVNGTASILLTAMTNKQATLNIRFSHGSAVKTQNAKMRIYDRSNIDKAASGVTTKVAELIHPTPTQTNNGSGDSTWITPGGSAVIVDFVSSPGISGLRPNGADTTSTRHDWFAAISASPISIGSKTLYGLYFETEFL